MVSPANGTPPARGAAGRMIAWAALAAALIAWFPWLGPLAYPFRLLSTLVHELGHGLAAVATGGDFQRLVVFADGSGLAYTAGGWRFVIVPAGYLGTAAFGAGLILLGGGRQSGRWSLAVLGVALGLLSLRYGLPSLGTADWLGGALAVFAGGALGGVLVTLALKAGERWIVFTIHLLAIQVALAALSDLWTLIGISGAADAPANDARSMAEITWLPALFWALLWAVLGVVLIAGAIRVTWLAARAAKPRGRRRNRPPASVS